MEAAPRQDLNHTNMRTLITSLGMYSLHKHERKDMTKKKRKKKGHLEKRLWDSVATDTTVTAFFFFLPVQHVPLQSWLLAISTKHFLLHSHKAKSIVGSLWHLIINGAPQKPLLMGAHSRLMSGPMQSMTALSENAAEPVSKTISLFTERLVTVLQYFKKSQYGLLQLCPTTVNCILQSVQCTPKSAITIRGIFPPILATEDSASTVENEAVPCMWVNHVPANHTCRKRESLQHGKKKSHTQENAILISAHTLEFWNEQISTTQAPAKLSNWRKHTSCNFRNQVS